MQTPPNHTDKYATITKKALHWFAQNKRTLPWREHRTPYRVWLAEIMLQQTTVATVEGYYTRFLEKFPTVQSLAAAPLEDVLHLWQGLGYYSRAKNLHKCAQEVSANGGTFPQEAVALQKLPGIGPYTAASVASIAFDNPTPVVDANIERVVSRLFEIHTPLPQSKPEIYAHTQKLTPKKQSGNYAEAMMDLGATICSIKKPKCSLCPLQNVCIAYAKGIAETLPKKLKKPPCPIKEGIAYCITTAKGQIFLQKRPQKGLLANLWEVPHINWEGDKTPNFLTNKLLENAPLSGTIKHVFTHFTLNLEVRHILLQEEQLGPNWVLITKLEEYPTSTLMKKVLACII